MAYWFINTDEGARKDVRTCDLWFAHGMAFSGGEWEKYGLPLRSLAPSDICLMYHNGLGIVGVGRVLESWDGQACSDNIVYDDYAFPEYRLRVDWYIDIRENPIDTRAEFGYIPRGFLGPIFSKRLTAASLVSRLESLQEFKSPDELYIATSLQEGGTRTISVDMHERNPVARKECIEHWGTSCMVCDFVFLDRYGPIGQEYIHVHHLTPLGTLSGTRIVDPVKDLRPVCANCHAIIHKKHPPYSIEEVRGFISKQTNEDS